MTGRHSKTKPEERQRFDLDVDPGIGCFKGSYMTGADPKKIGRTNK